MLHATVHLFSLAAVPPSFSFATLGGSQPTLESQPRIHLPKFPGFSTFIGAAPAHDLILEDSGLDMHYYRSYGSLDTDHTGRSLDTFGSLCGPISDPSESEQQELLAVLDVTAQVHQPAPLQTQAEHQF